MSVLKELIRAFGRNVISTSYFYLGLIVITLLGIIWINCFFSSYNWFSTSKVISIFFLEWFTRLTVLEASPPTLVTPNYIFWSSLLSSSSFRGIPSPFTLTIILLRPLMSNTISYWYLTSSRGVKTIGILSMFFSILSILPLLFLTETISTGKTTCPEGILTSR